MNGGFKDGWCYLFAGITDVNFAFFLGVIAAMTAVNVFGMVIGAVVRWLV
jgi:hypothetical protein